ncbi:MAG: diguanylate cyclase [Caldisericaceae bacterium]
MKDYPYANFTFERSVKTYRGLLKGVLSEEKDFFNTLSLKHVNTLKELVRISQTIMHLLKLFALHQSRTSIGFTQGDNVYTVEALIKSKKPYTISLRIIKESVIYTFKNITDLSPVAMVLLDENSNVIEVNKKFEDLFGYKESEIIGKNINKIITPPSEIEDGETLDNIAKQIGYLKVERKRLTKDGRSISVLISGQPLELGNDKIGIIGTYEDITELKKLQEKLHYEATHDLLTNLPNKRIFSDRFAVEKAYADRNNTKIALFFMDIYEFKFINDTYGHEFGDKVLKRVGEKILSAVRSTDLVVRFGGDEFVVLCSGIGKFEDIVGIALKILNQFMEPIKIDDREISIGINIGITVYPDDGAELDDLIRKGDISMYKAKANGVNNFVFYTEDIEKNFKKTIEIKSKEIIFSTFFENILAPLLILDKDLNIIRANKRFKDVFKKTAKNVFLKNISDVLNSDIFSEHTKRLEKEEAVFFPFKFKLENKEYNFRCMMNAIKSFGELYYFIAFMKGE